MVNLVITIDQVGAWDNTIHMCVQLGIFHIFRIMGMFVQDYTTGFIEVEMQAEHRKSIEPKNSYRVRSCESYCLY